MSADIDICHRKLSLALNVAVRLLRKTKTKIGLKAASTARVRLEFRYKT
jgi:hypothetical protein